jgi:hypothetical protein
MVEMLCWFKQESYKFAFCIREMPDSMQANGRFKYFRTGKSLHTIGSSSLRSALAFHDTLAVVSTYMIPTGYVSASLHTVPTNHEVIRPGSTKVGDRQLESSSWAIC